jgi:hypothetical protein
MDDIDPKTERELVVDALENVLRDLWYEETPQYDHETYPEEFREFCESVLYSVLKKGVK